MEKKLYDFSEKINSGLHRVFAQIKSDIEKEIQGKSISEKIDELSEHRHRFKL